MSEALSIFFHRAAPRLVTSIVGVSTRHKSFFPPASALPGKRAVGPSPNFPEEKIPGARPEAVSVSKIIDEHSAVLGLERLARSFFQV